MAWCRCPLWLQRHHPRPHSSCFHRSLLQGSAREAADRRDQLLLAAKRLALELRGLDLLADHVKAVDALSRKLEAQVQEVVGAKEGRAYGWLPMNPSS